MKFKKGDLYEVVFWDHSSHKDPFKFAAVGYVLKDDNNFVQITSWLPLNIEEHDNDFDSNCEMFCIMKSCIISRKKLDSGKKKKDEVKEKCIGDGDEIVYYLNFDEFNTEIMLSVMSPKALTPSQWLACVKSFVEDVESGDIDINSLFDDGFSGPHH